MGQTVEDGHACIGWKMESGLEDLDFADNIALFSCSVWRMWAGLVCVGVKIFRTGLVGCSVREAGTFQSVECAVDGCARPCAVVIGK